MVPVVLTCGVIEAGMSQYHGGATVKVQACRSCFSPFDRRGRPPLTLAALTMLYLPSPGLALSQPQVSRAVRHYKRQLILSALIALRQAATSASSSWRRALVMDARRMFLLMERSLKAWHLTAQWLSRYCSSYVSGRTPLTLTFHHYNALCAPNSQVGKV